MKNRIALSVFFALSGCGKNEVKLGQNQAVESLEAKQDIVVGGSELGLSSPSMYASIDHVFNFEAKKDVSANVLQKGMWARVISGQTTDNTCQRGVLDPKGKLYTFYFGRFVNQATKQAVPFETKVDILSNLTATGVHAGQIFVSAVKSFYDKYGSAVVQVQFCANNVMKQSYVRSFKVTLTPTNPPIPPPSTAASISASVCLPNSDNAVLCTSTISWKNAPQKSCVFVESGNQTQLFACGGESGSAVAPWIGSSNPSATKFLLRDKENSSLIYASVIPAKPSISTTNKGSASSSGSEIPKVVRESSPSTGSPSTGSPSTRGGLSLISFSAQDQTIDNVKKKKIDLNLDNATGSPITGGLHLKLEAELNFFGKTTETRNISVMQTIPNGRSTHSFTIDALPLTVRATVCLTAFADANHATIIAQRKCQDITL